MKITSWNTTSTCRQIFLTCTLLIIGMVNHSHANEVEDILDLSLEQLLNIKVTTASGIEETLRDAPAAMIVISREDIAKRAYTSIGEIFQDLPGFDAIGVGYTSEVSAYQRGYRTTATSRTLIAINGVLDNHLWNHRLQTSHQYPMKSIERIEVLYGPAGAIYGPNAFLGVINIITKQPDNHQDDQPYLKATASVSDYDTLGMELDAGGQIGPLKYNFGLQYYTSNGADLHDYSAWGFTNEHWLNNSSIWGPVLQHSINGAQYGEYLNPTNDWGFLGEINYENTKLGAIIWQSHRGYGLFYTFDHAQPNADWTVSSRQLYLKNKTHVNDKLTIKTLIKYRENDQGGDWTEATPDWNTGLENFSYVSISDWRTESSAWKFRSDIEYKSSEEFKFTTGIKYESKELTKAFDVCNYWTSSFCSYPDESDQGPHDLGPGVYHTTDLYMNLDSHPLNNMPDTNMYQTVDKGAYLQFGWNLNNWLYSAGVRWDNNSEYGTFIKPRISVIHHFSNRITFKTIYAEAFQEPPPLQLWGGWSGRRANPDLSPEEVRNIEFIFMFQQKYWLHDMSWYYAQYKNVIKEEAENSGDRDITGFEYRGRFKFSNDWDNISDISGNLYYSWTNSRSSINYSHDINEWVNGNAELGDIAPHKANAAINFIYRDNININLKANWVSDRKLYLRNPLREQGDKIDSYTTVDLTLSWNIQPVTLTLKVNNLLDEQYYHPGGEQADSGNDFSNRAKGFRNSLIPQLGRQWLLMTSYTF